MIVQNLIQGSPEWHVHRANHYNASDAPAMLGQSTFKTRTQLMDELATGLKPEVNGHQQDRFDDGHRFEALARPLAEKIIGEDLYPVTGSSEDSPLSASYDGLTIDYRIGFEHKTLNNTLRAAMGEGLDGHDLPIMYQIQMEQQCMVSGATKVLFMASLWHDTALIEERHCWYYPRPDLRAKIVAGWNQFKEDLATYVPRGTSAPAVVGRDPGSLPALRVEVTGMVTASNLEAFKDAAMEVLGGINRSLQTDEDFASAEETVKWAKGVEDKLELTKQGILSQTADIEAVFRTIDEVSAETRRVRLDLDRLVKAEKEARRAEIVRTGIESLRDHVTAINATMGRHVVVAGPAARQTIVDSIKNKKSLSSMRDAVSAAVANEKVTVSQRADAVRACVKVLDDGIKGNEHLFPDAVALCETKSPEDLQNLIAARIAAAKAKADAEAEAAKAKADAEAAKAAEVVKAPEPVVPLGGSAKVSGVMIEELKRPAVKELPLVKMKDINALLAPLTITQEGLRSLGFEPVDKIQNTVRYKGEDVPRILVALVSHITERGRHLFRPE